jgi:hypothetical protein
VADPTEIVRRQLEPRKLRRVSEGSQQVTVAQESRIGPDIDRKKRRGLREDRFVHGDDLQVLGRHMTGAAAMAGRSCLQGRGD